MPSQSMTLAISIVSLMVVDLSVGLVSVSSDRWLEPTSRTVHTPDLTSLVQRVMTGTYTVDPAFLAFLSHPSAYYTDLYGIHALKDFTSEKIIQDFVPTSATLINQNSSIVELQFHSGWKAVFYPHSLLVIKNVSSPTDHVYLGGDNAQGLIEHLKEFRQILREKNLESTYLISNPYYSMEKQVEPFFYSGKPSVAVPTDTNFTGFQASVDAVLLYPDPVHGDLAFFTRFIDVLKTVNVEWLGMEMLPSSMQKILDAFCLASEESVEYLEARSHLTSYFLHAWTPYFGLNITSGDESPYFQAVDVMRQKKGRVYGLDFDEINFILFRYGESSFGASVRNFNWANSVPLQRRGIVFGGSAHFTQTGSINVQDFLTAREENRKLFSIRNLTNSMSDTHTAAQLVAHLICALLFLHVITRFA